MAPPQNWKCKKAFQQPFKRKAQVVKFGFTQIHLNVCKIFEICLQPSSSQIFSGSSWCGSGEAVTCTHSLAWKFIWDTIVWCFSQARVNNWQPCPLCNLGHHLELRGAISYWWLLLTGLNIYHQLFKCLVLKIMKATTILGSILNTVRALTVSVRGGGIHLVTNGPPEHYSPVSKILG